MASGLGLFLLRWSLEMPSWKRSRPDRTPPFKGWGATRRVGVPGLVSLCIPYSFKDDEHQMGKGIYSWSHPETSTSVAITRAYYGHHGIERDLTPEAFERLLPGDDPAIAWQSLHPPDRVQITGRDMLRLYRHAAVTLQDTIFRPDMFDLPKDSSFDMVDNIGTLVSHTYSMDSIVLARRRPFFFLISSSSLRGMETFSGFVLETTARGSE